MSIRIMDQVWRHFPGDGSDLLAMLALADWCNDEGGSLHPSIRTVARRIRTSESQARRILHKLLADGWLTVVRNEFGGAPGATRHYVLAVAKLVETARTDATPSASATPRMDAQDGSHRCAETAGTHASQTVKKQPPRTVNKERGRSGMIELPDWLPAEAWSSWDSQRTSMNKKGWTEEAKKKSLSTLMRLHAEGQDAVAVINNAIEKGWSGLHPLHGSASKSPPTSRHGGFEQRTYGAGGAL